MSTSIHVYKILCSKYFILYLSEFKPSVSNFLTPFTSFSYLKLNEGKRNKNFKQQWREWRGIMNNQSRLFHAKSVERGKSDWNFWNENQFYLPPWIRLFLAMAQHCVSGNVHWISCNVIADMLQSKWNVIAINSSRAPPKLAIGRLPIWHVIVFAAPSPKRIRKSIHGPELFHGHCWYAAENRTVRQSEMERQKRII